MRSGSWTRFALGSNIKCHTKVKKIKNERPTFWETMLLLALKRHAVKIFCCWETVLNKSGSGSGTETGTKTWGCCFGRKRSFEGQRTPLCGSKPFCYVRVRMLKNWFKFSPGTLTHFLNCRVALFLNDTCRTGCDWTWAGRCSWPPRQRSARTTSHFWPGSVRRIANSPRSR